MFSYNTSYQGVVYVCITGSVVLYAASTRGDIRYRAYKMISILSSAPVRSLAQNVCLCVAGAQCPYCIRTW